MGIPNTTSLTVLEAATDYLLRLQSQDKAAIKVLVDTYGGIFQRLEGELQGLANKAGGGAMTKGQLVRDARYKALMEDLAEELEGYGALTQSQVKTLARHGLELGERNARDLMSLSAVGTRQLNAEFNRLNPDAIEQLLGFLQNDSKLYRRLKTLAPSTHDAIREALVQGVGLGYNPRKIASQVEKAFGLGLQSAMRHARTAQLWAYRESSRATYMANSQALSGWQWAAKLDSLTCMSCVRNHGTFHRLDDRLNDHWNGRCGMIPIVGQPNPQDLPIKPGAGKAWFDTQPPEVQRQMLGKGMYEEYSKMSVRRKPKFWAAISVEKIDPIYGKMRFMGSFKDVFGVPYREWKPPKPKPPKPKPKPARKKDQPKDYKPKEDLQNVTGFIKGPKSGKYAKEYQQVFAAIDQVHGDGELPEVPLKTRSNKRSGTLGHYRFGYQYDPKTQKINKGPIEIMVNSAGDHRQLTLAHEIGHYLDYNALGTGKPWSDVNFDLDDSALAEGYKAWQGAVKNSSAHKALNDVLAHPDKYTIEKSYEFLGSTRTYTIEPDLKHIKYLQRDREVFARSYAQYVAKKSGDEIMLGQLGKQLEDEIYGNRQWEDDDFEPIMDAFDTLFRGLGWLK